MTEKRHTKLEPYWSLSLHGQPNAIRLLDLSPSLWTARLHGTLRIVSLDDQPEYEALSYTWGASTEGRSMTVDSHCQLQITDNLFRALRRLRRKARTRTVWIDAICIDQDDDEEKSQQVSMMGTIYNKATSVVLWLGECPGSRMTDLWTIRPPYVRKDSPRELTTRGYKFVAALDSAIGDTNPKWSERAWVVQEFVMAEKLVLLCGPLEIMYKETDFQTHYLPIPHFDSFSTATLYMTTLRSRFGEQSISEAWLNTSLTSCSDPRDKVYSLLSMINEEEARLIKVDYGQSYADLCATTTFVSMFVQREPSILAMVDLDRSPEDNLPTWAVDFAVGRLPLRPLSLSRGTRCCAEAYVDLSSDARLLTISGVPHDRVIRSFSTPSATHSEIGENTAKLAEQVADFLQACMEDEDSCSFIRRMQGTVEHLIEPSLLMVRGDETRLDAVIDAAFAVWDDIEIGARQCNKDSNARCECGICEKRTQPALNLYHFLRYARSNSETITFFVTAQRRIGIAASSLEVDDQLVYVNSYHPIVLRRSGDCYVFRGFAMLHSIRKLREPNGWRTPGMQEQKFVLC